MFISYSVLRLAILHIFAEADGGVREPLSFHELGILWRQTGLRDSDLRDAVRGLLDAGEMVANKADDTLVLSLSPELLQDLDEPVAALALGTVDEEMTLFRARHRDHVARGPDRRDRAGDRP